MATRSDAAGRMDRDIKLETWGTRLLGIYQALRVWPELNIDATDVLSQPLIEKFHQAASVRGVEAKHRVMLFE
jgi:hypothetical protein